MVNRRKASTTELHGLILTTIISTHRGVSTDQQCFAMEHPKLKSPRDEEMTMNDLWDVIKSFARAMWSRTTRRMRLAGFFIISA